MLQTLLHECGDQAQTAQLAHTFRSAHASSLQRCRPPPDSYMTPQPHCFRLKARA
jgi:hypothetical protein